MALNRSIGSRPDVTRGTTAQEVRKGLLQALFARTGVLPGGASPLVTGTAGWAYNVGAKHFVTQRAVGDGYHLAYNDGTVSVGTGGVGTTVPAAPASGLQRYDIIWIRVRSADENSDTTSDPDFGVTVGAEASSASVPSIPPGAMEIARNLMTSAATTTASAGNTITQSAPISGLVVPVSPHIRMYATSDLARTAATWSQATNLVGVGDLSNSVYTAASGAITVVNGGVYSISAVISMTGASFAIRIVKVSGVVVLAQSVMGNTTSQSQSISTTALLAAGDQIIVQVYPTTALSIVTNAAATPSSLTMTRLGA
jgi:hypothetical protein